MRILPTMVGVTAGVLIAPAVSAPICGMLNIQPSGDSIGVDDFVQAAVIVGVLMVTHMLLRS